MPNIPSLLDQFRRKKFHRPPQKRDRYLTSVRSLKAAPTCCWVDELGFGKLNSDSGKYALGQAVTVLGSDSVIKFDEENRRIVLTLTGVVSGEVRLWINYSQVERADILTNSDERVIFTPKHAPRIDVDWSRQSRFPGPGTDLHAVLYRQLLIGCVDSGNRAKLEQALKRAIGEHKVEHVRVPVTMSDNSYTNSNLRAVDSLMSSMSAPVAFKIDQMLRDGMLTPTQVIDLHPHLATLQADRDFRAAELVLDAFAVNLRCRAQRTVDQPQPPPLGPAQSLADQLTHASSGTMTPVDNGLSENLCWTRFATVTPTGIDLDGPLIAQSNATLRKYSAHSDHFLRVAFRDENHDSYNVGDGSDVGEFIRQRFRQVLLEGIKVGGRTYEFYACSATGLKEQQAVFVYPFVHTDGMYVDAETMREELGDFSECERNPAKLLSRLGQSLSVTQVGTTLRRTEIEITEDVWTQDRKWAFTDGCGTVSPQLAQELNNKLDGERSTDAPASGVESTCFQIRLGGAKGMFSLDPTLKGRKVRLRKSMVKFGGTSLTLDVAKRFTGPMRAFTNRPLVQVLEALKVPSSTFLRLQQDAVDHAARAKKEWIAFVDLLATYGLGSGARLGQTVAWLVTTLRLAPRIILEDNFTKGLVDLAILHSLRELKFRTRIPLPANEHFNLVGIADEDGILEEGEVYACIQEPGKDPVHLKGIVAVSRSPTLHPGDVQRARAVGRIDSRVAPRLAAQVNCIVFSVRGIRPLPSMLSGGDLDGDVFLVSTRDLIPPDSVDAAEYDPASPVLLDRPSTKEDMVDFFVDHTLSYCVGQIASRLVHHADVQPQRMFSDEVRELGEQFSHAIDSPKSGRLVDIDECARAPYKRPDFIQKELDYARRGGGLANGVYESPRVAGKLFRAIGEDLLDPSDLDNFATSHPHDGEDFAMLKAVLNSALARDVAVEPALVDELAKLIKPFADSLRTIASVLSPHRTLTEQEVMLGIVSGVAKRSAERSDVNEQLVERAGHVFVGLRRQIAGEDGLGYEARVGRVWAALRAAERTQMGWGVRSFVWVALSLLSDLGRIGKQKAKSAAAAVVRRPSKRARSPDIIILD